MGRQVAPEVGFGKHRGETINDVVDQVRGKETEEEKSSRGEVAWVFHTEGTCPLS